ncbi:B1 bradykinin receptor-like [Scomber japonicus]|uniref:B1 bradykinin receptor-like n=1 Tax=Scomber japonicus TaxID=13676 RepID=UPI0023055A4E|nr:B1 bradykinin receptor-like [Scomber japonicus]
MGTLPKPPPQPGGGNEDKDGSSRTGSATDLHPASSSSSSSSDHQTGGQSVACCYYTNVRLPLSLHSVATTFSTTAVSMVINNTNGTCPMGGTIEWTAICVLLISMLGIVLNVFVLMVYCLHKNAFTVPEIYLSNLAAVDLVLVSCLPFWALNVIKKFYSAHGEVMCKLLILVINLNICCSIYFLVLIVVDRYLALVHPLSSDRFRRPKYAKLSCLLVWGFGLLLAAPALILRVITYNPQSEVTVCNVQNPSNTVYALFKGLLILRFILPFCIISFCTYKIVKALKSRAVLGSNNRKAEHKATTLVLAVLVAFLICWVPYHIVKILQSLSVVIEQEGCYFSTVLSIAGQTVTVFALFNSVLNPILYIIVGKNFRKKVKEVFSQCAIKSMTPSSSLTPVNTDMTRS